MNIRLKYLFEPEMAVSIGEIMSLSPLGSDEVLLIVKRTPVAVDLQEPAPSVHTGLSLVPVRITEPMKHTCADNDPNKDCPCGGVKGTETCIFSTSLPDATSTTDGLDPFNAEAA